MKNLQIEIRDIVFDYFNIISKEYEISLEKHKDSEEYKKAIKDIMT